MLPTYTQLAAKITQFFAASDKAHALVNGPATGVGSTVSVESGILPTFAKRLNDFIAEITYLNLDEIESSSGAFANAYASSLAVDQSFTLNDNIQTGAGAISLVKPVTLVNTTGTNQALTLANGTNGIMKTIVHRTDGGSAILTPTLRTGFSTVTFNNSGDTVTLAYYNVIGWVIISSRGVVIA